MVTFIEDILNEKTSSFVQCDLRDLRNHGYKFVPFTQGLPEAYSEPCQTSEMEFFTKLLKDIQPLIIMLIKA